jgi:hypothetical protein
MFNGIFKYEHLIKVVIFIFFNNGPGDFERYIYLRDLFHQYLHS